MKPPRSFFGKPVQYNLEQIGKVLSNISFGTTLTPGDMGRNITGSPASGTSPGVANTEFIVAHNLGRIPIGFLILSVAPAAHIYKSTTAWTATNIYLKSDVATVAYTLFII